MCDSEEETGVSSQELSPVLVTELLRPALLCEVSPQLIRGGPVCGHHSWETVSCPALGPQHGLRPGGRVAGRADMPQHALPSGAAEGSVPLDYLLT